VTKVAVFIDGGHLRACARSAKKPYTPDLVIKIAKFYVQIGETLFRILHYDCEEFAGSVKLPVSGGVKSHPGGNPFLSNLAREELVAVRRGILKFRGWERRASSLKPGVPLAALTDADFPARWEQKGVDFRIGLDIVTMTESRAADLIVLLTGDTDLIPAMKLARGRGLQLAGLDPPNRKIIPELKPHLDFFRQLAIWP